ncbi:unnamed protein product [Notodromas monacha]|uniref:Ig-like domain-containing protein n=1 Tax=Notodromas monacha TaxID=399045 RepID=A0A7R9C151_9CRUS|nr:unnamed protein product [Notodromas monacha]CAG0923881.1 unnamed protein product [Notodromas monacha]
MERKSNKPLKWLVFWYDDRINEEFKAAAVNMSAKLMPDGKRWEVRSSLTFTPTRDHDGQNLTCSVMNSAAAGNPLKTSITLNVKYAPSITLKTIPEKISESDDVILNCSAVANPPDIRFQWIFDGERILETSKQLEILSVNRRKAGSYFCNVSVSGFPPVSKEYSVVIQGRPRIESPVTQYGKVGEVVFVVCHGFAAPSLTAVEWFFRGEKLQISGDPHFDVYDNKTDAEFWSTLQIFGASSTDFGEYNCSVVNDIGGDSRLILLKPQRSLPLPTILAAVGGVIAVIGFTIAIVVACQRSKSPTKPFDDYGGTTDESRSDLYGRKVNHPVMTAGTRSSVSTPEDDDTDETGEKRYFHQQRGTTDGGSTWDQETSLYDTAHSNSTVHDGGDNMMTSNYYYKEEPQLGPTVNDPRYCALYGNPYLSQYAAPLNGNLGVAASQTPPPPDLIRRPKDYITVPVTMQSTGRPFFPRGGGGGGVQGTAI